MKSRLRQLALAATLAAAIMAPRCSVAGLQTTIQRWALQGDDVEARSRFVKPDRYSPGSIQVDAVSRPELRYDDRQGNVSLSLPARFVGLSVGAPPSSTYWPTVWFDLATVAVSVGQQDFRKFSPNYPRALFWFADRAANAARVESTPPSHEQPQFNASGRLAWTLTNPLPPTNGYLYPDLIGAEIELGPVLPAGLTQDFVQSNFAAQVSYRVARYDHPLTNYPLSVRFVPEPGGSSLATAGAAVVLLLRFLRPTVSQRGRAIEHGAALR